MPRGDDIEVRAGIANLIVGEEQPLAGAWGEYYKYKDRAEPGTPRGYAIPALKRELAYRGFGTGLDTESLFFGAAARDRTKEFQLAFDIGLKADGTPTGVIASGTARKLFKKRVWEAGHRADIPALWLCRQINLESGFDPAAVGNVDPRDRGLVQINSYWHPDVSDAEAFDPVFSINWAADYMSGNIKALGDVEAGVAAHNVGRFYARSWLSAGKPVSGLYTAEGRDYAAIITKYLMLVKGREC